ncbi:MAG: transposase [Lewinellaceae bacterium]|nr:transposase [Lewinellaceae bacterium]
MTYSGQWVWNEQVVEDIKWILDQEFVDYGYRKVTRWLQQSRHYMINEKKVYRLMKEHQLVNKKKRQARPRDREWVKDLLPPCRISLEYLEIDIKYGYVHGQRRNGLTVTVIDVESRWVLGHYMAWSIQKRDIIKLFEQIFSLYSLPKKIYVRNDNGSQFIAAEVRQYFADQQVSQEFIKPATPEQNAHIESYHSIVEKLIWQSYDFEDLGQASQTYDRFIQFYNYERIHSGIGYTSPYRYLTKKKIDLPEKNLLLRTALCCRNLSCDVAGHRTLRSTFD